MGNRVSHQVSAGSSESDLLTHMVTAVAMQMEIQATESGSTASAAELVSTKEKVN